VTTNPDAIKIATSMVVLSFPHKVTHHDIEEAIMGSNRLQICGPIQSVRSGSEIVAVTRLSYKARNASKNHIARGLKVVFDEKNVVHVASADVVMVDE